MNIKELQPLFSWMQTKTPTIHLITAIRILCSANWRRCCRKSKKYPPSIFFLETVAMKPSTWFFVHSGYSSIQEDRHKQKLCKGKGERDISGTEDTKIQKVYLHSRFPVWRYPGIHFKAVWDWKGWSDILLPEDCSGKGNEKSVWKGRSEADQSAWSAAFPRKYAHRAWVLCSGNCRPAWSWIRKDYSWHVLTSLSW